jgi:transposase
MIPASELPSLDVADKDALIAALLARLDELKERVTALEAENTALRAANEALRAENAALREKLRLPPKTPENSSKPPAQGHKSSGAGKPRPKRKVHPGAYRPLHPQPTRWHDVFVEACPHCAADLHGVPQRLLQEYDRIEIPQITPEVTRVRLHGGFCPCCATRVKGTPPTGLEPGSPFGPNLRAFVLYLRFAQGIPFARLARLLSDLLGLALSEGALANILAHSATAFTCQAEALRQRLLGGTLLQSDETGARVADKTGWIWVFHDGDTACFVIRPSRGKQVVREFLGAFRPEIRVSDRLAAQMGWATKAHQVCLAHLRRDVQHAIDAGDNTFAPAVAKLLRQAIAIAHRRDRLADSTLKRYAAGLERQLDDILTLAPAHAQGDKLKRVIKKYRQNLFVFVTRRDVPPTNNASEQAVRPCVIFRKVTNCFRSQWGADLYAAVRSVLETARRRGIPLLDAIRSTLAGETLALAS